MTNSIPKLIISTLTLSLLLAGVSYAQPYGTGTYNANVPYGNETSLSINTSGNVTIPITPTEPSSLATGSSTVTITSTDVVGYKLYIRSLTDTNMNNLSIPLPASANVSAGPLAVNTWGYNTDASSNFIGLTLTDALIRSTTIPTPTGEVTTVTYGVNINMAKPAGRYTADVIYTAVPQTS